MTGYPLSTEQNPQFLVQTLPKIINVAVGLEKHSAIFGHRADSHTVLSPFFRSMALTLCSLPLSLYFFVSHRGSLSVIGKEKFSATDEHKNVIPSPFALSFRTLRFRSGQAQRGI